MFASIVEAVAAHALEAPDRLCLADGAGAHTYGAVYAAVADCSRQMRAAGVQSGDRVLVMCTQDAAYSVACLACQLTGAVFVPVERGASAERISEIAAETQPVLCIGAKPVDLPAPTLLTAQIDFSAAPVADQPSFPAADELAEILYSTGTTGKSKGIALTHAANVAVAENVCDGVQMQRGGVELIPMPLSHSHGLRRHYANLLFGNGVVIADGVTFVKRFFGLIDRYGVTALDLAPSAANLILQSAGDRLGDYADRLDYVQLGSAPLLEEVKLRLCALLPHTRLYNFYGSTESGCSCILNFNDGEARPNCLGRPTLHTRFRVVDASGEAIVSSRERTGYLASAGEMNMREYWRQPELTQGILRDGYVLSKDVGFIGEDGYIYMIGRDDDVINFGGIKIAPEEIESAVMEFHGITDCACVPKPDAVTGQRPVVFVSGPNAPDTAALLQYLGERIDANKLPREVRYLERIPRTYNGKLLRRELVKLLIDEEPRG